MRRMTVIAGHYGSGKTELAVSLAMELAQGSHRDYPRLAIVDLGGNDAGARVLRQFGKYFEGNDHELWAVVNFRRYETLTVETAWEHVEAIQNELQIKVTGLVNNTHLLRETTSDIIREGYEKAKTLSEEMHIPLLFTCYPAGIVQPEELKGIAPLRPLGLYMRPAYLDK